MPRFILLISVLIYWGCDTTDSSRDSVYQFLVSEEYNRTILHQDLAQLSTLFTGISDAAGYAEYDVELYRIVYNTTDVEGKPVEASGAVLVPKNIQHPGLLSVQHVTIFSNDEAPSVDSPGTISVATRKALLASLGYITFLPDYLGYGTTSTMFHPYQHKETLASATYDMIRAGLEFVEKKGLTPSGYSVNLAGYSEGAYATLAVAERIETGNSTIIPGIISIGSPILDLVSTADNIFKNISPTTECSPFYAYFIYSYYRIYNFTRPLGDYFSEPVASMISDGLFEGEYTDSEIRSRLPNRCSELFNESFILRYLNGDETELTHALAVNTLLYIPQAEVILTHGTADDVAPIFNSDNFFELAIASGKKNINYVRVDGATHVSGVFSWALETLQALDRRNHTLAVMH